MLAIAFWKFSFFGRRVSTFDFRALTINGFMSRFDDDDAIVLLLVKTTRLVIGE